MRRTATVALCVSVLLLAFVGVYAQQGNISYQIHSFNDLRQWHSILRKGATWFKFDPLYMPAEFCKSIDNKVSDKRGCFVLTHDMPTVGFSKHLNTSQDLVDALTSSWIQPYFQQTLTIALCFKAPNINPCNSTDPVSQNWMELATDLVKSLEKITSQTGQKIHIVLDGSATVTRKRMCLKDAWRPWNMTWQPAFDDTDAMNSNDKQSGFDRLQVLDCPVYGTTLIWQMVSALKYGKFARNSEPLLVWEPNDQRSIAIVNKEFIRSGVKNVDLRFATNSDPVQFEVYAGQQTGNAWHEVLDQLPGNVTYPKLAVFEGAGGEPPVIGLFALFDDYTIVYTLATWEGVLPSVRDIKWGPVANLTMPSPLASNEIALSATGNMLLVWASQDMNDHGGLFLAGLDRSHMTLVPMAANLMPPIDVSSITTQISGRSLFGLSLLKVPSCALSAQIFSFGGDDPIFPAGVNLCLFPDDTNEWTPEQLESIRRGTSAIDALAPSASSPCGEESHTVIAMAATDDRQVYSAVFCANLKAEDKELVPLIDMTWVGVGSYPQVSIVRSGDNKEAVLVTHSDSYCWNHEERNKNVTRMVCDSEPVSEDGVLTYTYASLSEYVNALAHKTPFSVCSETVLHGVYSGGRHAASKLFVSSDNQIGALSLSEGILAPSAALAECGAPLPTDRLVLDSWLLPPLVS